MNEGSVWKYVVGWTINHTSNWCERLVFETDRQLTDDEAIQGARLHLDEKREFAAVIVSITVFRVDTYMMGRITP